MTDQNDDQTEAPPKSKLIIEFSGYGLMRIPTDPDPTDDPRGISGYSFAFGDEPDLDRVIRLQPEMDEIKENKKFIRSYAPQPMGVRVTKAEKLFGYGARQPVEALVGQPVNWEDGPKLENRNLILTMPGAEPIVPFNMRIGNPEVSYIYRTTEVDPNKPVYEASPDDLARMAAFGMYPEPDTVGRATGMWDALARAKERVELLKLDRERLPQGPEGDAARAVIDGRIWQLEIGINEPANRRIANSVMVERFNFQMTGCNRTEVTFSDKELDGFLDVAPKADWNIAFWIGGWEPDTLSAFFEGTLEIPYLS